MEASHAAGVCALDVSMKLGQGVVTHGRNATLFVGCVMQELALRSWPHVLEAADGALHLATAASVSAASATLTALQGAVDKFEGCLQREASSSDLEDDLNESQRRATSRPAPLTLEDRVAPPRRAKPPADRAPQPVPAICIQKPEAGASPAQPISARGVPATPRLGASYAPSAATAAPAAVSRGQQHLVAPPQHLGAGITGSPPSSLRSFASSGSFSVHGGSGVSVKAAAAAWPPRPASACSSSSSVSGSRGRPILAARVLSGSSLASSAAGTGSAAAPAASAGAPGPRGRPVHVVW